MTRRCSLLSSRFRRPAALAVVLLLSTLARCSEDPVRPNPADGLECVSPEEVGWSSAKLADVESLAVQSGYAAIMAVYDGKVFFSWGDVTRNFRCHSIRKPFLSALCGRRVARGDLHLDATLQQLGIDDIPPSLTPEEKQATARHLMQSRSGVYHVAAAETEEMAAGRPARGSHPPGTFFYYNNWDFNALGTIYRQETARDIFEAFRDEIAIPIGMQDFDVANCAYEYELDKSEHPNYAFRMSARDMLRFGVLYQKGGMWMGRRIVSAAWIEESTRTYSVMDSASGVGHGCMWYTIPEGSAVTQMVGSSGYYHTGSGVHALIVLPPQKLVIVERYDTAVPYPDAGDVGLQLGLMIIDAKVTGGATSTRANRTLCAPPYSRQHPRNQLAGYLGVVEGGGRRDAGAPHPVIPVVAIHEENSSVGHSLVSPRGQERRTPTYGASQTPGARPRCLVSTRGLKRPLPMGQSVTDFLAIPCRARRVGRWVYHGS